MMLVGLMLDLGALISITCRTRGVNPSSHMKPFIAFDCSRATPTAGCLLMSSPES